VRDFILEHFFHEPVNLRNALEAPLHTVRELKGPPRCRCAHRAL
jgi:hypothetical protein